jgi:uridine phosphorylase
MGKLAQPDEILYHIGLSRNMLQGAEYVIMGGDPYRSEPIAKAIDPNAVFLAASREHISYLCDFHGQKVLVCSSGLGGPNIGITVEELAMLDVKYFLRIGTCGAIQPGINYGDIIVSNAAVRLDGASKDYAPLEYPAVPSFDFTCDMMEGAKKAKVPHHIGITASTDTFWQGQERYDSFTGYLQKHLQGSMSQWRALNVMNFEMEAATLFIMCSVFGLHAACICGVVAVRLESEVINREVKNTAIKDYWAKVTKEGLYLSMKRRGLIK